MLSALALLVLASKAYGSSEGTGASHLRLGREAALKTDEDLYWVDYPQSWHQQAVRIVDHQFTTFAELKTSARAAKQAGVSVLQLVGPQKRQACPGPWYGGLQLCDHINGSFPAGDGTLEEWNALVEEVRPLRFMWWTNLIYWSSQGPVFKQALADTCAATSD